VFWVLARRSRMVHAGTGDRSRLTASSSSVAATAARTDWPDGTSGTPTPASRSAKSGGAHTRTSAPSARNRAHAFRDSHFRRFWPRLAILRHDRGLAASPPVRYKLKVEGSGYSPFPLSSAVDGQALREAARRVAATSASPRSVSRSAARRWAPSALASPTWSACRPAPTGATRHARRRGCRRAWRNR